MNMADLELTEILLPLPLEYVSLALVFMFSLVVLMSFCVSEFPKADMLMAGQLSRDI